MATFYTDPEQNPSCRYCGLGFLAEDGPLCNDAFNRPLIETVHFLVLPSWGHFVPGWLLVIPKLHFPCLGAMSVDLHEEFELVTKEAEAALTALYGGVIKFEHGAHSKGCAGSCVDHAHLHLVPTTADLHPMLSQHFSWSACRGISDLAERYNSQRSYLFYEDAEGCARMYDVTALPTQFLRAAVARQVGKLDKYDWRTYMGNEELIQFQTEWASRFPDVRRSLY
jgi:diadenosine tetraphosphate (Ap4A) HIT family hydrolase